MTNIIKDEAATLIDNFLINISNPISSDWKKLIESHPEFASEIADFAIIYGTINIESEDPDLSFDKEAYDSTISKVLNLARHHPSSDVIEKIKSIQGPSIKNVCNVIGIGRHFSLLNGILVGRIVAPSQIIFRLAEFLRVSVALLDKVLQLKYIGIRVPAFKSTNGKPEHNMKPISWEDAVQELDLEESETERLLELLN